MKVELILPRKEKNRHADLGVYVIPQTLTQLAACTPSNADVKLSDENLSPLVYDSNVDLVGISVMTSQVKRAVEISKEYKKLGKTVVWGGIIPSTIDMTGYDCIDSYVIGEAEHIWPRLLDDFSKGQLKREYRNSEIININSLPVPRKMDVKPPVDFVVGSIISSRGCCFDCEFCSASQVYSKKIRRVSPERFDLELGEIEQKFVAVFDENFMSDKKYAQSILDVMRKHDKSYFVQIDPKSALDENVAKMLGDANVKVVLIGFESVNPQNFAAHPKYVPPSKWGKISDQIHKYGMFIDGCFVLGFDNDKQDVLEKTLRNIESSGIDFPSFSILTPYPGTRLYKRLENEGRIIDNELSHYDLHHFVYQPKHIDPLQLCTDIQQVKKLYKSSFLFMRDSINMPRLE